MKDPELDKLLRSVPPPERPEQEKAEFAGEVVRRLSRPEHLRRVQEEGSPRVPIWAAGFAVVCLIFGFLAGRFPDKPAASEGLAKVKEPDYVKLFKEISTLFPDRLRGVVVRDGEVELVLADQPELPAGIPLLVELCRNGRCRTVITFSGQRLEVDGHSIEVLAGADDRVIVLADNHVWTSQNPSQAVDGLRINAHQLRARL